MGRALALRKNPSFAVPAILKAVRSVANNSYKRNQEKKLYALNIDTTVITAGNFYDITAVAQGDQYFNRDGAQIQVQDIRISLAIKPDATAELQVMRLMLVRWIQDSAIAAPTTTDLFEDTANEVWLSPYKFESRKYQVLYDKIMSLNLSGDSGLTVFDKNFTKSLATRVSYNGGANTGVNHIYLVMLSEAATDGPDVVGHVATRFIDV